MAELVSVVGLLGRSPVGTTARRVLAEADLVVGSRDSLGVAAPNAQSTAILEAPLPELLDRIDAEPGRVCVLASGDPGFFGIVRVLVKRFGREALGVHPAPSSVSLAFARLGLTWDDAVVVSAHGRPLDAALAAAKGHDKVAVLTAPSSLPEQILAPLAPYFDWAAVCSNLGEPAEIVSEGRPDDLAASSYSDRSVVVLVRGDGVPPAPLVSTSEAAQARTLETGRPIDAFAHRDGMITKPEVRAVALARLAVPNRGVVWDLGAGSGSVGIEAALLSPGLRVIAVEHDPVAALSIVENAEHHAAVIDLRVADCLEVMADLPDPDRVFVGGGGLDVVRAAWHRLPVGGRLVATFARMGAALEAKELLDGELVQLAVSRGQELAGDLRLEADNPVFVISGTKTVNTAVAEEHMS